MFLSRTYSMKAGAAKAQKFAREHPGWTAAAGVALLGTGACLVAPQAALGALGWQAAGPVAGEPPTQTPRPCSCTPHLRGTRFTDSWFDTYYIGAPAAWIQSAVYGAHTTGAFSAIQSFTMTGAAAAVGMVAAGCVNLAAGAGLIGVAAKEKVMKRRRA